MSTEPECGEACPFGVAVKHDAMPIRLGKSVLVHSQALQLSRIEGLKEAKGRCNQSQYGWDLTEPCIVGRVEVVLDLVI